ncbi:MAG: SpoIVB peptidase S55 domain-containing protein, partial [Planctomycetota bacterium]
LATGAAWAGEDATQIMPVSEVKAGMTGHGLTALKGPRPQRFQVEVLGVLTGFFAKGDLVLVRMSGPVIDEAGVIAGMSGSPVFIEGKLLGAVAYGFSFCSVPLAGVTPAADILRVRDIEREADAPQREAAKADARSALRARNRDLTELLLSEPASLEPNPRLRRAVVELAVPPSVASPSSKWELEMLPPGVRGLLPNDLDAELRPLPIPVAFGGMSPRGDGLLSLMRAGPFMPVQATGRAQGAQAPPAADVTEERAIKAEDVAELRLEPGAPIGAAFVTGDLDISGMGTLTWVEGDSVLAFGHSMFGSGETDLPLAVGEVQAVVPSVLRSFKLSTTGRIVGRIVQDREPAILARLGEEAPMFPCKVRVKGAVDEEFSYRVAGWWRMAPMFTFLSVAESSQRWEGWRSRYTLTGTARISLKGHDKPLVLENTYTSYSVMPPSMDLLVFPMQALLLNPYREVEIESIDYELEVRPGFEAALIESAWADRARAEPGSEVTVYVRLLQFRGDTAVKTLRLRIPDTAQPGSEVQILVCSASVNRSIKRRLDPGFFAPRSFEHLVTMLETMEPNRNLVMRASIIEQGVRYAGGAMPALPPSALSILQYRGPAGRSTQLVSDIEQSLETPWVLEGSQSLSVTIEKPGAFEP